jgi:sarcosine oxidase
MLDEDGGVIRTTAAIAALVRTLGAAIVADEVIEVRPDGEVRAGGAIARHDRVIVCAGRDTATLAAGAGLDLPVRVSTHTRLTYAVREPRPLACFQDSATGAYGDPLPGGDRYAVGLGERDPTEYVAQALPGLEPRPVDSRTCWVTELPWGHDAIAVWEAGALLFVAGNNLFKHAPALGHRIAADALDDLRPEERLGRSDPG